VGWDEEAGGARGLEVLEGRTRVRRSDQGRAVDHHPFGARGGRRGEAAAEEAGDGSGEATDARERHLRGSEAGRSGIGRVERRRRRRSGGERGVR
jgi:hypothetical protein